MANILSHELHALVHHVELSKAGWRDRALEFIALRAIDDIDAECSHAQVTARVNKMLPAPLGQAQVKQTLDDLISKGKVVETSSGGVKISESTREELHDQLRIQNEARARRPSLLRSGV